MDDFLDLVSDLYPDVLAADGLDSAIIGLVEVDCTPHLVYSRPLVIGILMSRDGMAYEEAIEFADFNIFSAYLGPTTPLFALCPTLPPTNYQLA